METFLRRLFWQVLVKDPKRANFVPKNIKHHRTDVNVWLPDSWGECRPTEDLCAFLGFRVQLGCAFLQLAQSRRISCIVGC